jgi:preprotein translocase subunit SecD
MARRNGIVFLIILVIFALTLLVVLPINKGVIGGKGLRLGFDLNGGVHLVYQAKISANASATQKNELLKSAVIKIQKRIDSYGITQSTVQKLGENRIMVDLPGFTDINAAQTLAEQTGFLEFREVEKDSAGALVYLSNYLSGNLTNYANPRETGNRLFVDQTGTSDTKPFAAFMTVDPTGLVFSDLNGNVLSSANLTKYSQSPSWIVSRGDDGTPLTGNLLSDAQPNLSNATLGSQPEVSITWNSAGSVIFDQIAKRLYNPSETYSLDHVLGIFLDSNLISAPQIRAQTFGGSGVINGNFTMKSATDLANLLRSGSLPIEFEKPPLKKQFVPATLGAEFKDRSWKGGLIGIVLVMLFMIAYYRLPGLMASLGLLFYGTLMLAIYKLAGFTMSLGDIGGFIVSLGIAVDANVLIFERMKEEFRTGRTFGAAIEAGFHRAWTAIWDSNVTTFIACIILYWLGSSAMHDATVMGFGLSLFIGAIVSMFTAVTVTRTLLRMFTGSSLATRTELFTVSGGKK